MKRLQFFLISIAILITIIFARNMGYLRPLENVIVKVFSPLGMVLNKTTNSFSGSFQWIGGIKNLSRENKDLKEKLNETEAEIASLQEAKKENESLRRDLNFKVNAPFSTLSASILMYDPSSVKQSVIINKGERDSMKKGMTVLSEGFLVGRIVETTSETSRVMLITDPSSAIPVLVQNSTASGSLKGQIGFGLAIEKVPQGDVLKQGQLVITSGLGGDYPKGLVVGKIDKIEKSDNAIFQTASVRPEVNFRVLERVMIVVN